MSNAYVDSALKALNEKFAPDYSFEVSPGGRKWKRIVKRTISSGGIVPGGSSYLFLDSATGDVYKTAGWNAPAKHVRHSTQSPEELAEWLKNEADPYGSFLYLR